MRALLSKKNVAGGVFAIVATVVLSLSITACSDISEFYEEQRLEEEQQKEEAIIQAQKEELYNKFKEIYLAYSLGENEELVIEFDKFLEGKFKNKEDILAYFDGLYKFNKLRFEEYEANLELLEKERNKLSEDEFANKEEEIKKRYKKSLNKIQDYFSAREREILESSEEEINALYNLL